MAAIAALMVVPASASAATRTWVSGTGNDANPCSRTAPCSTFAGAISKTDAGGEIDALDSGGFGAVTITKSVTISAVGVTAGVLVSGTNGITVQAGATDHVVLKGLDFNGLGSGLNGIRFLSGASLTVEESEIYGFADHGIDFAATTPGARLIVDGTSIHDNAQNGVFAEPTGSARALLNDDQITGNAGTGVLSSGAGTTTFISDDFIGGNGVGLGTAGGGAIVAVGANAVYGNGTDGSPTSTVSGGVVGLQGPPGAPGTPGATGKQGADGKIELVKCKQVTRTKKVHGKKKKVKKQRCTGTLVSGKVKFTDAAPGRAWSRVAS